MYDWYFNFFGRLPKLKQCTAIVVFVLWSGCSYAQTHPVFMKTSSFSTGLYPTDSLVVDTALPPVKRGLFNRLLAYFAESNKEKNTKSLISASSEVRITAQTRSLAWA